jgi:uncharacterized protein
MDFVVLGSVSFLAWLLSMVAGGGSPLILIPLVNAMLGAEAIAPVITIGMLISSIQRTLFFRQEIDLQVSLWHVPGAVVGAVLGAYALNQLHLDWLQVGVGIALLLMVLYECLGRDRLPIQLQAWQFLPLGYCNAFLSALIGSTGPLLNPFYLNYGLVKEALIATKSANVFVIHGVKTISYSVLGNLNFHYFWYGLVIGLAAIPANWIGKAALDRMSGVQFRKVVFIFLAISGVLMLWDQRALWLGIV